MLDRRSLVNKLKKEEKKLEFQVNHSIANNVLNYLLKIFLKIGIGLDYALPFILAACFYFNMTKTDLNEPFKIGIIEDKPSIETITTSTEIKISTSSFDYNYSKESFEHSTAWFINEHGLFERTITSYQINDEIDLEDKEKIFNLDKEEIEKLVSVVDVRTIQKSFLEKDEEIYNEEMFIITEHYEDEENVIKRKETSTENVIESILYILFSLSWGNNFRLIGKLFIKTYFRDKLRGIDTSIRPVNKEELNKLKSMLEIKRENLMLLDEDSKIIDKEVLSRSLKKEGR